MRNAEDSIMNFELKKRHFFDFCEVPFCFMNSDLNCPLKYFWQIQRFS